MLCKGGAYWIVKSCTQVKVLIEGRRQSTNKVSEQAKQNFMLAPENESTGLLSIDRPLFLFD